MKRKDKIRRIASMASPRTPWRWGRSQSLQRRKTFTFWHCFLSEKLSWGQWTLHRYTDVRTFYFHNRITKLFRKAKIGPHISQ
jgi:hypothetical protein